MDMDIDLNLSLMSKPEAMVAKNNSCGRNLERIQTQTHRLLGDTDGVRSHYKFTAVYYKVSLCYVC